MDLCYNVYEECGGCMAESKLRDLSIIHFMPCNIDRYGFIARHFCIMLKMFIPDEITAVFKCRRIITVPLNHVYGVCR